ncbi:protein mono-ADP-ribosyltransferase PARP3-like [Bradysia coprophila]|uniref:protein mono-ADP-ribosyltransferase PARP3-like n=1 Tax=Bradysia coprophila TaxID=38358 RepID=UPI00187D8AED|nr:protein mono-ADP-ribosyltransferase PARP3-like [Bradysia coprophila]
MYHHLDRPQNILSLRPATAAVTKYDHTKENIYLDRIARLMHTDRATLDSYAKIKLWEDGPNYQKVVKYVNNSQYHPNIKLTVVNIHRVWQRNRDDENLFHISNRKLLWHGTKRANIPQILKNGFKLPEHAGQMFGSGIYFADRISKSSNYSDVDVTFLLLCEVGLGKVYSCKTSHNSWKSAPSGFDSVKANGTYVPDWTDDGRYFGAEIPFGRTAKCTKYSTHAVNYNEFIVYDPSRVIIRFLVEVNVERVLMSKPLNLVTPKSLPAKNKGDAAIHTTTIKSKRSIDVRSTSTKTISLYPDSGAIQTTTKTFSRGVDVRSSTVKTISRNPTLTATQAKAEASKQYTIPKPTASAAPISNPSSTSTLRCANWVQQSYSTREAYPQRNYTAQQPFYSPSMLSDPVYTRSSYTRREIQPQRDASCTIL